MLLLFACIRGNSQVISVVQVVPTVVCPGDTINVWFKWDRTPGYYNFFVYGIGQTMISNRLSDLFYSFDKALYGSDTIYNLKTKTLASIQFGPASVECDYHGSVLIYFYCSQTNLNKITPSAPSQASEYFDVYGNRVQKDSNRVLIERNGDRAKKVIFTD